MVRPVNHCLCASEAQARRSGRCRIAPAIRRPRDTGRSRPRRRSSVRAQARITLAAIPRLRRTGVTRPWRGLRPSWSSSTSCRRAWWCRGPWSGRPSRGRSARRRWSRARMRQRQRMRCRPGAAWRRRSRRRGQRRCRRSGCRRRHPDRRHRRCPRRRLRRRHAAPGRHRIRCRCRIRARDHRLRADRPLDGRPDQGPRHHQARRQEVDDDQEGRSPRQGRVTPVRRSLGIAASVILACARTEDRLLGLLLPVSRGLRMAGAIRHRPDRRACASLAHKQWFTGLTIEPC